MPFYSIFFLNGSVLNVEWVFDDTYWCQVDALVMVPLLAAVTHDHVLLIGAPAYAVDCHWYLRLGDHRRCLLGGSDPLIFGPSIFGSGAFLVAHSSLGAHILALGRRSLLVRDLGLGLLALHERV